MQNQTITFQLATQSLSKIALRLECLFITIEQALSASHPLLHHYALKNTIEMLKIIEKPEIKSRFLKELMRIEHSLHHKHGFISNKLAEKLSSQIQNLSHSVGRFGPQLQSNAFLQAIRLAQSCEQNDGELHSPMLL